MFVAFTCKTIPVLGVRLIVAPSVQLLLISLTSKQLKQPAQPI